MTEGPSDETILSSAMGVDKRAIFPVGGRKNLIGVAEALEKTPLSGVICVGDRDFDAGEDTWSDFWWLVLYDEADVEAMLIEAEPLARFLEEWASKDKLAQAGGIHGVRSLLRDRVMPLSSLRTNNAREKFGLPIDSVDLTKVIEKTDGTIRRASLIGRLSHKGTCTNAQLEVAMDGQVPICPHTKEPLARGRDLMAVLSVLLRQLIGSLSRQQIRDNFVERSIRLAVRRGDFDNTPFQQRLEEALAKAVGS